MAIWPTSENNCPALCKLLHNFFDYIIIIFTNYKLTCVNARMNTTENNCPELCKLLHNFFDYIIIIFTNYKLTCVNVRMNTQTQKIVFNEASYIINLIAFSCEFSNMGPS
jgi:hypothetical protein